MLAVLFAVFNQLSGINAIIYYSPRIFEMTGLGKSSSLLSTAGLGVINFMFTLLAMNFIDRIGRRTLMMIGSFGLIFTLAMVSYSFYSGKFKWLVGSGFPFYIYRIFCFFTGSGYLGIYFRNISQSGQGKRPDAGQYNTLGDGCTSLLIHFHSWLKKPVVETRFYFSVL